MRADTAEALITVEAHHAGGRADVEAAVSDLVKLLRSYAGAGRLVTDTLDATHAEFSRDAVASVDAEPWGRGQ